MPELLAPAGNFEKLKSALLYGADAVYFAGESFGMRAAAGNFDENELIAAIKYCREHKKKAYLTINTFPREYEYPALEMYLQKVKTAAPDAVIAADDGVIELMKEIAPEIPIHLSTQTSTVSSAVCRARFRAGIKRIVLARELTLDEIKMIRKNTPSELELEVFIHGSMCISYSGRCMLSKYFTGRDANNGLCTQPCRWHFNFAHISEDARKDDVLRVEESENGTFFFSSKDLCMIEHIPELIDAGIDCFKIEGRMKSAYYTAVTSNTYRMAIDRYIKNPAGYKFDLAWQNELESVSHREYDTGFFFNRTDNDPKLTENFGYVKEKSYLAVVTKGAESGYPVAIEQRNKVAVGEKAELLTPGLIGRPFTVSQLYDEEMSPIDSIPHPRMKAFIILPYDAKTGDIIRA